MKQIIAIAVVIVEILVVAAGVVVMRTTELSSVPTPFGLMSTIVLLTLGVRASWDCGKLFYVP